MITTLHNPICNATKNHNRFLKSLKTFLFLIILVHFTNQATAQVSAYTFSGTGVGQTYTAIAGGTAIFGSTTWDDNITTAVPINFNFTFNGNVYTSVNVSANGFITFGTAPTATNYTPISSSEGYQGAIAAYGMDLTSNGVSLDCKYTTVGAVGSRVFTVEYLSVKRRVAGTVITGTWTFQINLYEGTNVVEIKYKAPQAIFNVVTGANGQIGLRGNLNSDFNNLLWSTSGNWPGAVYPTGTFTVGGANTSTVFTKSNTTAQPVVKFQWTPVSCTAPSYTATPVSAIASTSATLNWNAVSPAPTTYGYEYYVTTSATLPTMATTPTGTGLLTVSTNLSSLTANTLYYAYVRTKCDDGSYSAWSAATSFTTLCTPSPDPLITPYFQGFDNPATNVTALPNNMTSTLPYCTSKQNSGAGNDWMITDGNSYYTDSAIGDDYMLIYNGQIAPGSANPANAWFFTGGIHLTAGTAYQISYEYGGTHTPSAAVNKMKVAYGTSPSAASMTIPINDLPNIKASPFLDTVNFTAPSTGIFYFGFNAYSDANEGQLYLDDVQIVPAVCLKSTAVTVANIGATSALLSWTAPSPAPAQGYVYYYAPAVATATSVTAGSFVTGNVYQITALGSTNFTLIGASANVVGVQFTATGPGTGTGTALLATAPATPTNSSSGSGLVGAGVTNINLTGLSSGTVYYFWVRTSCGSGDYGEWVPLTNGATQYFNTIYQPPFCFPSTALTTAYINKFATTGGFDNINNSSGLSTNGYGDYTNLIVSQAPTGTINFTVGLVGTVGVAIWVDWNNDGTFAPGERMYTSNAYILIGTVSGSFAVPGGQASGNYRMRVVVDTGTKNPSPCAFTGAGEAEDYTFKVEPTPPALTLNSTSSIQCASTNSPLVQITSGLANYSTYSWSPNTGITGNSTTGYTFNSNTTITYVLTGTQTAPPYYTNSVTYTYTANPLPSPITIATPAGTVACQSGPAIPMTASGGIVAGVTVLSENFNTGAPGWTSTNTSSPAGASANWTIRPSGYNPGGATGITSIVSNDSSPFYLCNSDSLGVGSTTNTELISPVFSLAGYTDASLSFYHFVEFFIASNGGYAKVLLSTDGGSTYPVTLKTWSPSTDLENDPTGATATSFKNTIISLTSYAGLANLRIKFKYNDQWGYVWAIDNFLITGSASSSVVWNTLVAPVSNGSPVPGLYTSTAATTAYTAGTNVATVYAMPSVNTTFTASANTPSPVCTTTTNIAITVNPIVAGTVAGGGQTICAGTTAGDLTLSGQTGTIVQWQWSTSPTFASGINNITASASTTLTGAQIGAITTTTYYRVEISNGTCNHVFTVPVVINVNSTTWNGAAWSNGVPTATTKAIFNGNYTSSGNLSACSVQVNSGTVDFLTGHNLIVTNEVNVAGGTLKFENSSSLVQTNNSTNTGSIEYHRNTTPMVMFDYTYWSAPVSTQEIHAFSPSTLPSRFYLWDTSPTYNWVAIPSAPPYIMIPGNGYIIRAPEGWSTTATSWPGVFTGVPNNGDVTIPIVVTGANNLNLIGNPYPSSLNADAFLGDAANALKINGAMYFWTHNTVITANNYNNNDYATYNIFGGVGTSPATNLGINNSTPNGHVAAGDAFFVEGITSGSVTFKNTMRELGNNNQFFKMNTTATSSSTFEKHRMWLEISNTDGLFKQMLLGYADGATNGKDRSFDADALDGGNPLTIYAVLGQDQLVIKANGLPFSEQDLHPIGYSATTAGTYQINLAMYDGLFENQNIYLEDKLLNVIYDLKQAPYTFTTDAGMFNDRFVIRFAQTTLAVNANTLANGVVIFKNTSGIHIQSTNTAIKEVMISDARGRIIYSKKGLNISKLDINNLNVAQEVLIVQVTLENGTITNKKIVY